MNNITDDELYILATEENEEAKTILFERYKYIIGLLIKKYKPYAMKVNMDLKELYAEGLYGFSDALYSYSQDKSASFPTFLTLCVERRFKKQLNYEGRHKNMIIKEALSLDDVLDFNVSVNNALGDEKFEPLNTISSKESYDELLLKINSLLSTFEYSVFTLMVNGYDYKQIAKLLKKTSKQIDNTCQRIKIKIKNYLKAR